VPLLIAWQCLYLWSVSHSQYPQSKKKAINREATVYEQKHRKLSIVSQEKGTTTYKRSDWIMMSRPNNISETLNILTSFT
jgi:hypothetical protein